MTTAIMDKPFQMLDTPRAQLGHICRDHAFYPPAVFRPGCRHQSTTTPIAFSLGLSGLVTGRKVEPKFGYNIGEAKLL